MIRSTQGGLDSGTERRWLKVFRTLNEFQARLFAAVKALDLGRGGISRLAALTGLTTITKAVEELGSGAKLVNPGEGRVRRDTAPTPQSSSSMELHNLTSPTRVIPAAIGPYYFLTSPKLQDCRWQKRGASPIRHRRH